jgi:hypothetical protein
MAFLRDGDKDRIAAYFGSRAEWEAIGDWSTFWPPRPDRTPSYLDHGFDEEKHSSQWTALDMVEAASFRGGTFLSDTMTTGDVTKAMQWECAFGHQFSGSARLILTAGHWCPVCVRRTEHYAEQADRNPFLAQLESGAAMARSSV